MTNCQFSPAEYGMNLETDEVEFFCKNCGELLLTVKVPIKECKE